MHHHGSMAGAILGDVFQVEPLGELKVYLDGGIREFAPVRIADLEVDLGSVEGGLSNAQLIGLAHGFQRFDQCRLGALPLLFGAEPFVLDVVPGREPV